MYILAKIHTAQLYMWEYFVESKHLVFIFMTTIVDDNIYLWLICSKHAPECFTRLIADVYRNTITFIDATVWFYIYANNSRLWAEIVLPHVETAATIDTN